MLNIVPSFVAVALIPLVDGQVGRAQDDFRAETIDSSVAIGYGVAIGDVDGDGKSDILLADQKQFVWYRNPDWKRYVMVENLTEHDNVCIAARDLDGDGRVEVAVGAQWNPADTHESGSVHYLVPPDDRTKLWKPIALPHEPVVHRMNWVRIGEDQCVLVVAPLHGRGNVNGDGDGVRLLAYQKPTDPESGPWTTTLLDDQLHVTHNFDAAQWNGPDSAAVGEEIVYLGREGALLIEYQADQWRKRLLPIIEGGGEIRVGRLANGGRFLATVEPFHGDKLVIYEYPTAADETRPTRSVVNPNLSQGHAVATGDFLKRGSDQVVVGWRNPNEDGKVGIMIHWKIEPMDEAIDPQRRDSEWAGRWVDENEMACEDLRVADLDGDGDLDIVAAGRSTHNLKIYWNQSD